MTLAPTSLLPLKAMATDPVTIMLVDDSAIVRGMVSQRLAEVSGFKIVSSVANGEVAVNQIKNQPVDVVVLDIEMPVMDGLTALPKLLALSPATKVIMASTLTERNAEISLKALELGAADYIPKPSSNKEKEASDAFYRDLIEKIKVLAPLEKRAKLTFKRVNPPGAAAQKISGAPLSPVQAKLVYPTFRPQALAIASSTGGPQALLEVFKALKGDLMTAPIFITQHMPPKFTTILAQHIKEAGGRDCHEAVDGEAVEPGKTYLAPGGYHMVPRLKDNRPIITLNQNPEVNFCRPAADPMIDGLVDIYGNKLLLLVLTGMGQDGLGGARKLCERGGFIVAQDQATSVVWGMPGAVVENNLAKMVLPLSDVPEYLAKAFGGGV